MPNLTKTQLSLLEKVTKEYDKGLKKVLVAVEQYKDANFEETFDNLIETWLTFRPDVQSVAIGYEMEYGDEGSYYACASIHLDFGENDGEYYDDELGDLIHEYMEDFAEAFDTKHYTNPNYKEQVDDTNS